MYASYNEVTINGESVSLIKDLTHTQFLVLSVLNMHFNNFVGAQYISRQIDLRHDHLYDWNARIHIVKIRKALAKSDYQVVTGRSSGYKLTKKHMFKDEDLQ